MSTPEPVPETEPCCGFRFTEQPPPVPVCVLAPGHPGRHFPCLDGRDHGRMPHRYRLAAVGAGASSAGDRALQQGGSR